MAADGEGAQPPPPPARLFRLDRLDEEAAELTAALEAHSFVLLTGLQARRRVVALRVSLPAWLRHCICHVPPLPWSRLRHCLCLAMLQPAEATVINRLFAALQKFFAASSVKGPPLSDCLFISLPLCLCASLPLWLCSCLLSPLLLPAPPRPSARRTSSSDSCPWSPVRRQADKDSCAPWLEMPPREFGFIGGVAYA